MVVTEGRTHAEAIERLRVLAQQRLTEGEMVCLEIPEVAVPYPWGSARERAHATSSFIPTFTRR
jgi:hypothetical protein